MADDEKDQEGDPNADPVIAGALERMKSRLKPGEDPFYYDIAREAEAPKVPEEGAHAVYVAPTALPPLGEHKTIPNARVMVTDPRKMPTIKKLDRPPSQPPASAAAAEAAVNAGEAASATPGDDAPRVGPRGTAKMSVVAQPSGDEAPPSSRKEPAASPWAKEADETPLLARDLPSSHRPMVEAPAEKEQKRSMLPIAMVLVAIVGAGVVVFAVFGSPRPPETTSPSSASNNAAPASPSQHATSAPNEARAPLTSTSNSAAPAPSLVASEMPPAMELPAPSSAPSESASAAPSTAPMQEASPRVRPSAAPKTQEPQPAKTSAPAATAAPGPTYVPPFQFPDEQKK